MVNSKTNSYNVRRDDSDGDPYNRHFYEQPEARVSDDFRKAAKEGKSCCASLKQNLKQKSFYKRILTQRVPIVSWLFLNYKLKLYLLNDLISGFTVGIMNLPQSMGYALLANLAPVNGLYMSFFPLLIYALFGTSRHIAMGTIAIVSLLSGEVVQTMADQYSEKLLLNNTSLNATDVSGEVYKYKVVVACALSFFVGVVQMLMAFSGLGVVTRLFSDSFISGYTTGSAIHVLFSQFKEIFGIKAKRFNGAFKIPRSLYDLTSKLLTTNIATLVVSAICIAYIIVFKEFINPRIKKRFKFEFPSELLLVIFVTVSSYFLKFETQFKINTVKSIPTGLPVPQLPDFSLWTNFIQNGILIALIAFSINISLATFFAKKNKYEINANQELFAYGASNIFGSFFSCYPNAASLSRSSVQEGSGGKTQLAAVFSSVIILTVILWLGPLFTPLPKACLASIIVVALKGLLFQFKDFVLLWKCNKYEAALWFGTFLSVVLLDVDMGLFIGIILSVLLIVIKDHDYEIRKLIKYNKLSEYVDQDLIQITDHENPTNSNVVMLKLQRSLYFINIDSFKVSLFKHYGLNPANAKTDKYESVQSRQAKMALLNHHSEESTLKSTPAVQQMISHPHLILDFSAVNYIDTGAVRALAEVIKDFENIGVLVCICNSQDKFITMINRMGSFGQFKNNLFVSISDAFACIQRLDDNVFA